MSGYTGHAAVIRCFTAVEIIAGFALPKVTILFLMENPKLHMPALAVSQVWRIISEFWQPALCYRDGLDLWLMNGQPTAEQRARQRWQELLAAHQDPPLNSVTARQLTGYLEKNT